MAKHGGKRPGSGAPAFLKNPVMIGVNVEKDLRRRVRQIAQANVVSMSTLVRHAIRWYLQELAEGRAPAPESPRKQT